MIRELLDKAARIIPGQDWQVYYASFSRAGFTPAARADAQSLQALLVDLNTLDHDLKAS